VWFAVETTDANCPVCGVANMPGYRKPYRTKNGDLYHYWALVCVECVKVFDPASLDPQSQKRLKKHSIPVAKG
jgi:hypothetical protein